MPGDASNDHRGTVPAPGAPPRRSVLVVDDDAYVVRSVQRLLETAGYAVTLAADGNAAMATIMGRSFDVVLSDIDMPGMTGVELLKVVRSHDLDVPVVLMTGAPSIETAIDAVSFGALQYLTKPMASGALLKAIERASRLHRMARMKREALEVLGGEEDKQVGDRAGLQASFDRALDQMWMAYQPIVDPVKKQVFGYEALMRTREPVLPHPGAILQAAERLERLWDVGRRVRALSAEAFELAPPEVSLFVNLHTHDLLDPTLYDPSAPLTRFARRVVLEITERATIDGIDDMATRVSSLRALGFRIALDDLGAGYAGLSSFAALEPEIVKLDMSLVRDVHRSDIRRRLVGSMTALCKEMGMRVVAEGIEVDEERDVIQQSGCDLLQGYLFAKPDLPFPPAKGCR